MADDCNGSTFAGFTGLPQGDVVVKYGADGYGFDMSTLEISYGSGTRTVESVEGDNLYESVGGDCSFQVGFTMTYLGTA